MLDLMEWVWPRGRVQAAVEETLSKTMYASVLCRREKKRFKEFNRSIIARYIAAAKVAANRVIARYIGNYVRFAWQC